MRVFILTVDGALESRGRIALAPGSGPRHLAAHPTQPVLFVNNELDNTVPLCSWTSIISCCSISMLIVSFSLDSLLIIRFAPRDPGDGAGLRRCYQHSRHYADHFYAAARLRYTILDGRHRLDS